MIHFAFHVSCVFILIDDSLYSQKLSIILLPRGSLGMFYLTLVQNE